MNGFINGKLEAKYFRKTTVLKRKCQKRKEFQLKNSHFVKITKEVYTKFAHARRLTSLC